MTNVYRVRICVPTLVGDLNIDGVYIYMYIYIYIYILYIYIYIIIIIPIVFASPVIVYS